MTPPRPTAPILTEDPPFDPPDTEDVLGEHEIEDSEPSIDRDDVLAYPPGELLLTEGFVERRGQYRPPPNSALTPKPAEDWKATETPTPPISIYASWDRPAVAEMFTAFAADRHLARAEITIARGGLDGAITHCAAHGSPDLLILDTTLGAKAMLAGLDRLAAITGKGAQLIILGAVNDVGLLRELAARGVADYIVPPARRGDLVHAACKLFAHADKSRVIAVAGARGGVGTSTLAQNLAWSIAARQGASVSLIDLDFAFGSSQTAFAAEPGAALEGSNFTQATALSCERLSVLAAAAPLAQCGGFDAATLDHVLYATRRASSFVILDLPHDWTAWVKHALLAADATLLVATPDLASLRNCENLVRMIREAKPGADVRLAMSMTGVQKRPEIPTKDFVQAVGLTPSAGFDFDAELYGLAALKRQMIGEAAAHSKTALAIDALATALTGRAAAERQQELQAAATPPPREAAQDQPSQEPTRYPFTFREPAPLAEETDSSDESSAPSPSTPPVSLHDYLLQASAAAEQEAREASARERRRANLRLVRTMSMAAATAALAFGLWRITPQSAPAIALAPQSADARQTMAQSAPAPEPPLPATADPRDGLAPLRHSAESGEAAAQYDLALAYQRGDGAPADLTLARQWTERAAQSGHCRAMHDLGVAFAHGEGGPRDDAAAFRWFRQAAELDVADSQYNLGVFYQQGIGVGASLPEALFWFLLAARSGDAAAGERAATLEGVLPPVQVEQARARALAFQPRQAVAGAPCNGEPAGASR